MLLDPFVPSSLSHISFLIVYMCIMFGWLYTVVSPGSSPQVRVWSHRKQRAERFRQSVSGPVTVFDSVEEAVRGADAIVTVTRCTEPVLFGQWVKPGAHVAGEKKKCTHN